MMDSWFLPKANGSSAREWLVGSGGDLTIARLERAHCSAVETLLRAAFPRSIVAIWGGALLRAFVDSFRDQPGGLGYVALDDGRVMGFLLGCEDAAQHRRRLIQRAWPAIVWDTPRVLIQSPSLVARLVKRAWPNRVPGRDRPPAQLDRMLPPASLILMAVAPPYQGRGLGRRLMRVFFADLAERGIHEVKLAVGTANQAALRLYLAEGGRVIERYRAADGETMYRLALPTARPVLTGLPARTERRPSHVPFLDPLPDEAQLAD